MIILVLIGYAGLIAYEFIPLYREKQWYDFWVNAALGGISLTIAVLLSLGVKIPSPSTPIKEMVVSLFGK